MTSDTKPRPSPLKCPAVKAASASGGHRQRARAWLPEHGQPCCARHDGCEDQPGRAAQEAARHGVARRRFNTASAIDGDTSTNDAVIVVARRSGRCNPDRTRHRGVRAVRCARCRKVMLELARDDGRRWRTREPSSTKYRVRRCPRLRRCQARGRDRSPTSFSSECYLAWRRPELAASSPCRGLQRRARSGGACWTSTSVVCSQRKVELAAADAARADGKRCAAEPRFTVAIDLNLGTANHRLHHGPVRSVCRCQRQRIQRRDSCKAAEGTRLAGKS